MSNASAVYKIFSELKNSQSIPSYYNDVIEERLIVSFTPVYRQRRGGSKRTKVEIRRHHWRKKAQRVYLDVLDYSPYIFLPFILAISPNACRTFDLSTIRRDDTKPTLYLKTPIKEKLEDIAKRNDFDKDSRFTSLLDSLFPQTLRPITDAGTGNFCWVFCAAELTAIRDLFGDNIWDGVNSAPIRAQEKAKSTAIQSTECVKTNFPKRVFQDAIISVNVGFSKKLAGIFFPSISDMMFLVHSAYDCFETHAQTATRLQEKVDGAYLTFQGASVAAIASNLSPRVVRAIEESQLRVWEKNNLLIHTTDCVTMDVFRQPPHHGTLHIRVGFKMGTDIINELYADTDA